MRLKLPHAIRVGPKVFHVKYHKRVTDDKDPCHGVCDGINRTIEISTSLHNDREGVLATIFHETVHAVIYTSGQNQNLDPDKEEALVQMLETHFDSVIDWSHAMWMDWKFVILKSKEDV